LAGILVHQSRRARLTQVTLSAAWDRPKSYTTERWHGKTSLTVDELLIWAHLLDVSVEQVIAAARKRVSHHS
jgi:hypothetical protein